MTDRDNTTEGAARVRRRKRAGAVGDMAPSRDAAFPDEAADRRFSTGSLVKPVSNAFKIIRYLQHCGTQARASQIAVDLKLNMSTCFNILRTMVAEDIIDFSETSKTYSLGIGLARLVDQSQVEALRTAAMQSLLDSLSTRLNVTSTLWRPSGPERIELVAIASGPGELRLHMSLGLRLPHLMGASGRVIAAHAKMSKTDARAGFRSLRWERPIDFESYWDGVQFASKHGWAFDDGHYTRGITSVAAPIASSQGDLTYVISLVVFRGQFDDAELSHLGEELKAFADEFQHRML